MELWIHPKFLIRKISISVEMNFTLKFLIIQIREWNLRNESGPRSHTHEQEEEF